MRVLHVNNIDLQGQRFNGYDLLSALRSRGVRGKQAVLTKLSDNPDVVSILTGPDDQRLHQSIGAVEERHAMDDLLYPWGRALIETPEFKVADVVHYHLIHNRVVSLLDFPDLLKLKPSVWTIHDPWAFTGHCVYPRECTRWLTGCESCPSLDAPFPMRCDHASRMWNLKKDVYTRIDPDIIVASPFTMDMVSRSPLTAHFSHVHCIPFGITSDGFLPQHQKAESRRHLGIADDDFVILFRSTSSQVKGLSHIIAALDSRPPDRPTTLLTLDHRHLINELADEYSILEFGWVDDPQLQARLLSACDVFLMPSTGEAFGLMALEAMAAGRPVICFEGTSLPSVTYAPECGIAVPMGDSIALRAAIDGLARDPAEAERRGKMGKTIAAEHYDEETYLDALLSVYQSALMRSEQAT